MLDAFLKRTSLAKDGEDYKAVERVAAQLKVEHKWLSPRELENTQVNLEGQKVPFESWFRDLARRKQQAGSNPSGAGKLTDVEQRAIEVGTRLVHYQALRDREVRSVEPLLVMPRPSNERYLAFTTKAVEKARKSQSMNGFALLELDALKALDTYWDGIMLDDREVPGTNAKFDAKFVAWLRDNSVWVPLRALLDASPEQLEDAGYPLGKVEAFRSAFKEMERAEEAAPGQVAEAKAATLLATARDLGQAVNPTVYPTPKQMSLETYFNETNPFFNAPVAYGIALALLAMSLGFITSDRRSFLTRFGLGVYWLGMLGLAAGIGLEVLGFT